MSRISMSDEGENAENKLKDDAKPITLNDGLVPRYAVDALKGLDSPALRAAAKMAKLLDNPALKAAAGMAKMWDNPALRSAMQMARLVDNPALKSAREMAKLVDNPALKSALEMVKLTDNPALRAAAGMVKLSENSALQAAAEMSKIWKSSLLLELSPQVLKAFEGLPSSTLSNSLYSGLVSSPSKIVKGEGVSRIDISATGDVRVMKTDPDLEVQIVDAIVNGRGIESLPKSAGEYLREYLIFLMFLLEAFVLLVDVPQSVEYLASKLDGVKEAKEIRQVVSEIPDEHRARLSNYRVLTRDRVMLRSGPDKLSADLGRLQIGTPMEVLAESGGWVNVYVEVFGEIREGWVYRGFTAIIPEPKK
ncbi:SH3 domain-containing protein [Pseudomonas monteilii]